MEYVKDSETPDIFHKWAAVSSIAANTSRFTYMNFGHLTFYINFWILLVAPPGTCRKGDAIGVSREIIADHDHIKLASESLTREYLLNLFAGSRTYFKHQLMKEMSSSDAERLAPSALTVHSAEFGVFLGQGNIQFINDLTDLFDCRNHWTYGTIKHGIMRLDNTWLNILGAATPSAIQTVLPDFAIGGGFLSRFILVTAAHKKKKISLMNMKDKNIELLNKLKSDLELMHLAKGNMKFSELAKEAYTEWYNEFDESQPPGDDMRLIHYNTRKPLHLLKLAAVMSLSRSNAMIIEKEDLKEAYKLLSETEEGMSNALVGIGRHKLAPLVGEIEATIKKFKKLTYLTIYKMHAHDATKEDIKDVLDILESKGAVGRIKLGKDLGYSYINRKDRNKVIETK